MSAMTNAHFTRIDQYQDVESLGHYREMVEHGVATPEQMLAALAAMGRDNARTPVQWDASEHAGFTTGRPWLEVNPDHVEVNAEAAWADDDSVLHFYRRLHALRHDVPVVALGDFRMLLPDHEAVYAFSRALDTPAPDGDRRRDELLVLVNVGGTPQDLPVGVTAGWGDADVLLATHEGFVMPDGVPDRAGSVTASARLRPWEGVVLRARRRLSRR